MTWAEKVKEKDRWRCVVCGSEEKLQAHHIKPKFLYPEFRNDVDNGITLCKVCHQRQHGDNFSGYDILSINGIDPDPDGRISDYKKRRTGRIEERKRKMAGYHVTWYSNDANGRIVVEAAKKAKREPKRYVAEAISMRLKAEGYEHDPEIFIPSYRAWEDEMFLNRQSDKRSVDK